MVLLMNTNWIALLLNVLIIIALIYWRNREKIVYIMVDSEGVLKDSKDALRATNQWCDAGKALEEWQKNNPFESQSHPKAQELIRIEAGAYMLYLDAHPNVNDDGHLAWYMEQIEDWRC